MGRLSDCNPQAIRTKGAGASGVIFMTDGAVAGAAQSAPNQNDYIATYRAALAALAGDIGGTTPQALDLKHMAILALARAGSSAFAQQEFARYGLASVTGHEDIMALAGRLAKDRYCASADIEHARESATLYEAAFKSTGGYYSGINAATMSLIAGVPIEIVKDRARAVLARLSQDAPQNRDVSERDATHRHESERYYREATRAEAQYILGDMRAAQTALQAALDYDPLNYTAHASTYRQFKLLQSAQNHRRLPRWLEGLRPPAAVHFAGHLYANAAGEAELAVRLIDCIQSHDIGFGYGALAAGADIIFAECLLEEGGELHVVLPVEADLFCEASVAPRGPDWTARFESCLARAASVRVITQRRSWPDASLNNYSARLAMGHACMRAGELSSPALQVLMCSDIDGASLTAAHGRDWRGAFENTPRAQIVIDLPQTETEGAPHSRADLGYNTVIGLAQDGEFIGAFDELQEAMAQAQERVETDKGGCAGLHIAPVGANEDAAKILSKSTALSAANMPGSLLVSRDIAALLALDAEQSWQTGFMGWVEEGDARRAAYFAKPRAV